VYDFVLAWTIRISWKYQYIYFCPARLPRFFSNQYAFFLKNLNLISVGTFSDDVSIFDFYTKKSKYTLIQVFVFWNICIFYLSIRTRNIVHTITYYLILLFIMLARDICAWRFSQCSRSTPAYSIAFITISNWQGRKEPKN